MTVPFHPPLLGLFQKRIAGDDALLRLAARRFEQAGLGAEFYAETAAALEADFACQPRVPILPIVHLSRDLSLFVDEDLDRILDIAGRFAGRLYGLVIHDQPDCLRHFRDYVAALNRLDTRLRNGGDLPFLFIEYAAGLPFEAFGRIFAETAPASRIGCCLDIGHIGLQAARRAFARIHPGNDICALTAESPGLPVVLDSLQEALRCAPPAVCALISALSAYNKPLHFHLHDAHPLSPYSPFGIADHIGFADTVPIPFDYRGSRTLAPMFGADGLRTVITAATARCRPEHLTFTLEIHPREGREPLGEYAGIFHHWQDTGNAVRMNFWLSALLENRETVLAILLQPDSP